MKMGNIENVKSATEQDFRSMGLNQMLPQRELRK
jgi:hypothetical protein